MRSNIVVQAYLPLVVSPLEVLEFLPRLLELICLHVLVSHVQVYRFQWQSPYLRDISEFSAFFWALLYSSVNL